MTEVPDLITDRRERLAYLSTDFFNRLQDKHKEEEEALDRMYESHRRWIHRLHLKIETAYKGILNELLGKVCHDENVEVLEWLELVMRTKRRGALLEILEKAKAGLRDVEKNGGDLIVRIERDGMDAATGSCLYRDKKNSYFSFLDEFMDGYDDDTAYEVRRVRMCERERRAAEEARTKESVRKWIEEGRAKKLDGLNLDLTKYGLTLREVPAHLVDRVGGAEGAAEPTYSYFE
jgi:hypothetical protein